MKLTEFTNNSQDRHIKVLFLLCYSLYFPYFQKIPEGSIILLHACAHNPTGVDPKVSEEIYQYVDIYLHLNAFLRLKFYFHTYYSRLILLLIVNQHHIDTLR